MLPGYCRPASIGILKGSHKIATNLYAYEMLSLEALTPGVTPHSPPHLSHKTSRGTLPPAIVTGDLNANFPQHEFSCRLMTKSSGPIKTGLLDAKEN